MKALKYGMSCFASRFAVSHRVLRFHGGPGVNDLLYRSISATSEAHSAAFAPFIFILPNDKLRRGGPSTDDMKPDEQNQIKGLKPLPVAQCSPAPDPRCPHTCPECGRKLGDIGGYWGCLCSTTDQIWNKYRPVQENAPDQ
jgi:hypothetical protein